MELITPAKEGESPSSINAPGSPISL